MSQHLTYDPRALTGEGEIAAVLGASGELKSIARALSDAGYRTYLYGGAVRDLLIHRRVDGDLDIVPVTDSPDGPRFEAVVNAIARDGGLIQRSFPGHHVTLKSRSGTFDVLCPCSFPSFAVVRSGQL